MNYKEKYNEALARAKEQLNGAKVFNYDNEQVAHNIRTTVYNIFPKLKESESKDERIRKKLIELFHDTVSNDEIFSDYGLDKTEVLAWLEKQGEKKELLCDKCRKQQPSHSCQDITALGRCALEKQGEQKPANKVEPKFKIEKGKWYVCIRDLLDNYANRVFYKGDIYLSTQDRSLIPANSNVPFEIACPDTYFRDWTIEDAKDGDVLVASDGSIFIYKCQRNNSVVHYIAVTSCNDLVINENDYSWENKNVCNPATKEQQDLLFQRMKKDGYEFDAENRELKSYKLWK